MYIWESICNTCMAGLSPMMLQQTATHYVGIYFTLETEATPSIFARTAAISEQAKISGQNT